MAPPKPKSKKTKKKKTKKPKKKITFDVSSSSTSVEEIKPIHTVDEDLSLIDWETVDLSWGLWPGDSDLTEEDLAYMAQLKLNEDANPRPEKHRSHKHHPKVVEVDDDSDEEEEEEEEEDDSDQEEIQPTLICKSEHSLDATENEADADADDEKAKESNNPEYFKIKRVSQGIMTYIKKRSEMKEIERLKFKNNPEDYYDEPYIVVERLIEWDPEYTSRNRSFWDLPPNKLLQSYGTYIFEHKSTLELSFLDGFGYKFQFVSRKWKPRLITVKTLEKRPTIDNDFWLRYLAAFFYRIPWSYSIILISSLTRIIRRRVTAEIVSHWSLHKHAIKETYKSYILFFVDYNPDSTDLREQAEARWWYDSIQADAYMDFTLFEIAVACKMYKTTLTVVDVSLDGRFFLRRLFDFKNKGIHIWAREYIDPGSLTYRKYFLTPLKALPCSENKRRFHTFPNCELRLTFKNHKLQQYRLTQNEFTKLGMLENWNCMEKIRLRRVAMCKEIDKRPKKTNILSAFEAGRQSAISQLRMGFGMTNSDSDTSIETGHERKPRGSGLGLGLFDVGLEPLPPGTIPTLDDDLESQASQISMLPPETEEEYDQRGGFHRKVQFDSRVLVKFYKIEVKQRFIFRLVKWLFGFELSWIKVRVPCHVRDCRHFPIGLLKNMPPEKNRFPPDTNLKSILKNRVGPNISSTSTLFTERPARHPSGVLPSAFYEHVPFNIFTETYDSEDSDYVA